MVLDARRADVGEPSNSRTRDARESGRTFQGAVAVPHDTQGGTLKPSAAVLSTFNRMSDAGNGRSGQIVLTGLLDLGNGELPAGAPLAPSRFRSDVILGTRSTFATSRPRRARVEAVPDARSLLWPLDHQPWDVLEILDVERPQPGVPRKRRGRDGEVHFAPAGTW